VKLAIIRRECGFDSGGAEAYCANVSARLSEKGYDVTILADKGDVRGPDFRRAMVRGRGSIAKNISFFKSVEELLSKGDFDITYGLSRVAPVDVLRISDPLHAAWLDLGYSGRSWLRRIMPRHRMLLMLEKKAVNGASHIVVNSSLVKKHLMSYYDVSPERITVVYNGVDTARFRPVSPDIRSEMRKELGIGSDEIVLLFAGSDLRRKGFGPLAEAFCRLSADREGDGRSLLRLVVAGASGDRKYERFFMGHGLSEKVRWLGYRNDMENIYGISDMFVLPTRYDPFANTTVEAMSCGVPVVTTSLNGASEIYSGEFSWLVTGHGTCEDLFSAISAFLALPPEKRHALGHAVRKVAEEYSWNRHVDCLESLFRRVWQHKTI